MTCTACLRAPAAPNHKHCTGKHCRSGRNVSRRTTGPMTSGWAGGTLPDRPTVRTQCATCPPARLPCPTPGGGRPGRPSAHGGPGVAESPHGETNPGWRAMCPSPNRAGTPEAERCYRVNGATPCAVHRGATSPVHRGRRGPTRPNTRRRRPLLSHRVHRGTPRPHSRYHQAPGSGSGPLGRKWRKLRQGPRRSPWWRPPHGQELDDGKCTGRGLPPSRQAPFEADGDPPGPGHVRGPRAATPKARDGAPLREGHLP